MNRKISALIAIFVIASMVPLSTAQTTDVANGSTYVKTMEVDAVSTSAAPVTAARTLRERNKQIVDRYQDMRDRYQNRVDAYKDARADFISARDRLRTRRNSTNANESLERAKKFLLRADEAMIGHLEVMKVRIENTNVLPEDEKEDILREIDSYIEWLTDKQDEIEAATTKEELVDIAQAIRDKWMEIRGTVKKVTGQILSAKLDRIIDRGEAVSDKLDVKIGELKDKGYDTEKLERLLDDFNEKLDLAKDKNEAAKEKFKEIDDIKDADRLFREGHAFLKEANQYMRDAYTTLKDIVREMRSMKRDVPLTSAAADSAQTAEAVA